MRRFTLVCFALSASACLQTTTEPKEMTPETPPDPSTRLALEGQLCTPAESAVKRPLKVLVAIDGSPSRTVTDPNGTVPAAVGALLQGLPQNDGTEVAVMMFAGTVSGWLVGDFLPAFYPLADLTTADRTGIVERASSWVAPSTMTNATTFVKPFADIETMLLRDLASASPPGSMRPRYVVVFITDGHPTNSEDDALLCGDAITRIRALAGQATDVQVNTVHVFAPPLTTTGCTGNEPVPGCTGPLPAGLCPAAQVNADRVRLEKVAQLGGGQFRDFRDGAAVNLSFVIPLTAMDSKVKLEHLFVMNLSTKAMTKGLRDDADQDGFSDAIDARPSVADEGCDAIERGKDADCDGLWDCDEKLIRGSPLQVDTDDDGAADLIEWANRLALGDNDLARDPDFDGFDNGQELARHGDVNAADAAGSAVKATFGEPVTVSGKTCRSYRLENVPVVAGENDLYLSWSARAAADRGLIGQQRVKVTRPDNGVFVVGTEFTGSCVH